MTIDVEILTTDLSSSLSYGLSLPTSFALSSFLNRANLRNAYNYFSSSFSTYLAFGGGASLLGLGITNAQLFATVSESSSKSILHAQLVAVDGLPAQLHVGEKYPIITSGYFGNTSGSGTVYTPPPTVSFEDLGLLIKVTPHIGNVDHVTLDLEARVQTAGRDQYQRNSRDREHAISVQGGCDDWRMGRAVRLDDITGSQDHHRYSDHELHSAAAKQHDQQRSGRHADRAEAARDPCAAIGQRGLEGMGRH